MHFTRIVMKTGEVYVSPIKEVNPWQGWVTLFAEGPERIPICDIESAVTENERISYGVIGDFDELEHWKNLTEEFNEDGSPRKENTNVK